MFTEESSGQRGAMLINGRANADRYVVPSGGRWVSMVGLVVLWLAFTPPASADVLADCRALSLDPDDIHVCLDNFLDDLDDSMELLVDQVIGEVDEMSSALFRRSQAAFSDYRRQNCLWYVSFSGSRDIAEQLGKTCLVDMTRDRLAELRGLLVASEQQEGRLQGYYVFGTDLNSFIACGSGNRYWVESDNASAGELQQRYLEVATAERQLLYASLQGELVDEDEAYEDHAGKADITGISTLRVPLESDCPLPSTSAVATAVLAADAPQTDGSASDADAGASADDEADDGPEQQLNAYFGAWEAVCVQRGSEYSCDLNVDLQSATATAEAPGNPVQLQLKRVQNAQTTVELRFDGVEIDSPSRIRWGIDDGELGAIAFSVVRVDESATRQIIADPDFLEREFLPALRAGNQVRVEVLASEDDLSGEVFDGTLMGLSRALAFADDFIEGAGS